MKMYTRSTYSENNDLENEWNQNACILALPIVSALVVGGSAHQSSTDPLWDGPASRAVDGSLNNRMVQVGDTAVDYYQPSWTIGFLLSTILYCKSVKKIMYTCLWIIVFPSTNYIMCHSAFMYFNYNRMLVSPRTPTAPIRGRKHSRGGQSS